MWRYASVANPKIWFILTEGKVTGPCDQEEIESLLTTAKEPQIWGRGQSEWMTASRWRQALKEGPYSSALAPEAPGLWKIRIGGKEEKPCLYTDLIKYLKTLSDLDSVDVSPHGATNNWKEVFAYPQIVEELGITRRNFARVPLIGTLTCENDEGEFTCRVISISEGGLGVNDAKNFQIGQQFKATLQSANLFVTIPTTCEVVYVGGDGYAGLRFVGLPTEYKSSIVEYVNKFATA